MEPPEEFEDGFSWKTVLGAVFLGLLVMPASIYLNLVIGANNANFHPLSPLHVQSRIAKVKWLPGSLGAFTWCSQFPAAAVPGQTRKQPERVCSPATQEPLIDLVMSCSLTSVEN